MSECLCEKWSGISMSVGTLKDSIVFRGYRHERTIAWGKGGANPLEQICAPHPPEFDLIKKNYDYINQFKFCLSLTCTHFKSHFATPACFCF